MSSIEFSRHRELCERIRYRKLRRRADLVLLERHATSPPFAVRRSEAGIQTGPVLWWLVMRGIVRETGSGRLWLDLARRDRLRAGVAIRITAYLSAACLFSGAALAVAQAGF
ncbi:MAG: hypothetical protein ACTS22_06015 [Phycisphaerales bacterium]